jgi:hypothetical protein
MHTSAMLTHIVNPFVHNLAGFPLSGARAISAAGYGTVGLGVHRRDGTTLFREKIYEIRPA